MALTYQQIKDLIDANLNGVPKILPSKHREVENALLDYMKDIKDNSMVYLARGRTNIGDTFVDSRTRINFGKNIGTVNYDIIGSLQAVSGDWNKDNDVFWQWGEPDMTGFYIYTREVSSQKQNLTFSWFAIP